MNTEPEKWMQRVRKSRDSFFREPSDIYKAFDFSKDYSRLYNELITSQVNIASEAIFGNPIPKGVAIFSFGAPSRNEMMGRSDADVAVYRAGNSAQELVFRERLVESLQDYGFTKVDTPVWGTLKEIQRYMNTSVTEANQVMEAQFICGDEELRANIEQLRDSLYDRDVVARNLVFQFYYFDQYFRKKESPNHLNIKYCSGGTRDLLFPAWYAQLKKGIERDLQATAMGRGLTVLADEGLLMPEEIADILSHSSAVSYVRDAIMGVTPRDMDGKLSPQGAEELHEQEPHLFASSQDISSVVNKARQSIRRAKAKVWEGLCNYFFEHRSEEWNDHFRKAVSGDIVEIPPELKHDEIINTVRIWNLDAQGAERSSGYLEQMAQSNSWIILASLLSSPNVSGEIIDSVIRRKGLTPGYEYFLEIAARNPNLTPETLEFIITDNSTEPRFKKPALKLAKEQRIWQK